MAGRRIKGQKDSDDDTRSVNMGPARRKHLVPYMSMMVYTSCCGVERGESSLFREMKVREDRPTLLLTRKQS